MTDFSYDYGASNEELYKTDAYGGSDADIDGTVRYTSDIDLTSNIFATIDFKFDASGATDNLVLALFRRNDSTWGGAEIAIWDTTVRSDGTEDIYSLCIGHHNGYGPGHYRISMIRSGSTDTFEIDVQMRRTKYTDA